MLEGGPLRYLLLFLVLPLVAQSDLKIADPVDGAFLSGSYRVEFSGVPRDAITTRLYVNEVMVREVAGAANSISYDFGEDILRFRLWVEVVLPSGETFRSPTVVTQPLKIDLVETKRTILLSVSVTDRGGTPLTDLEQDQFVVKEDGKVLEIENFYSERLPLDLVLLLDSSSSLRRGAIDDLKYAAKVFLKNLDPGDKVALHTFKADHIPLSGFTTDIKQLEERIDDLNPKGETGLYNALAEGVRFLEPRKRGRRALILFTDGRDSVFEEPAEKAKTMREGITEAQNLEVTIFTIGLGEEIHEGALKRIADETGGTYHHADNPADLPRVFDRIITELKHQYVLGVVPKANRKGYHKVDVDVRRRGARVLARKGYTLD